MSRPSIARVDPPEVTVIDAVRPVAFSVAVEVPGPCVYNVPKHELPTFPTQRIPGEVDFWAQVDLTVQQRIIARESVSFGGSVALSAAAQVKPVPVQFGATVTFSVVSKFRYVRTVQFSGAAALSAKSVPHSPAAFNAAGALAVVSAVKPPAVGFGGTVTLSIAAEGGFQFADADFGAEVTFSVESRVRFTRTVDFTGSAALSVAALARFTRTAAFAGAGALAVQQFPKAPLPVSFGGSATLSIAAPIPVIPREVGFGADVTLSVAAVLGYVPIGMLKSGGTTTAASGTLKQVTGMIADPAYPGSSVTLNSLSVAQSKVDATIELSVNCTNNFTTTVTIAAYKNAVLITGSTFTRTGSAGTFVISGSVTATVTAGDLLTLMVSAANGTTTINVANTYLRVT